jgi:ABC-type lipoprotein export system ATPase subunit/GNAT superfamily N-acetyltransferase
LVRKLLRLRKLKRVYNRTTDTFVYNISFETYTKPTRRSIVVAEAFGLGVDEATVFPVLDVELLIRKRDIVYITGDSGSGKSVLLRALRKDLGEEAADLDDVNVDVEKPLIETIGSTLEEGLELLSKVGLNDAFLFLRSYSQLSDGQKYRYKVAKLIESGKRWWLADEFCASLDRDTAKIVAFNLQKLARQQGRAVIVATAHHDLSEDLAPDVLMKKRFGKEIDIMYIPAAGVSECSLVREMRVEEGSIEDWRKLSVFHYRGHRTSPRKKIFRLMRGEELCGVIVYTWPPPACYGRRMMLPKLTMREFNQILCTINRVVIHPKYRTIGLGVRLIRETLPLAGTRYVELIAVMAKYSPFAVNAGMREVAVQEPSKDILRIAEKLKDIGFDVQLLGSRQYVMQKLQGSKAEDVDALKEVFCRNSHPRLKKEVTRSGEGRNLPWGCLEDYKRSVQEASLERVAGFIRIAGMLLQKKVYLFWDRGSAEYINISSVRCGNSSVRKSS